MALAALAFAWMGVTGPFAGSGYAAATFGLAGVMLAAGAAARRWPSPDWPLLAIALPFLILCWASALWSIAPTRTVEGAVQITAVVLGALLLVIQAAFLEAGAERIFRAAMAGATLGAALALIDFLADFPIMQHFLHPGAAATAVGGKMDRGLVYLLFLAWPMLAYAWRARWRAWAGLLAILVVAVVAISFGVTLQLSLVAGALAFAIALVLPRLVAVGLAAACAASAALTPVIALDFGQRLLPFAASVKPSAVHRLEIWDYMSRRAMERPWTGWGWWTGRELPIRPDELARYQYVHAAGSPHPHGNWVQLWVETGVIGVALGLAFALLMIWRAWRTEPPYRPFALACCTSVFVVALASFDLASDSWWAALAAAGLLFAILPSRATD